MGNCMGINIIEHYLLNDKLKYYFTFCLVIFFTYIEPSLLPRYRAAKCSYKLMSLGMIPYFEIQHVSLTQMFTFLIINIVTKTNSKWNNLFYQTDNYQTHRPHKWALYRKEDCKTLHINKTLPS